MKRGEPITPLPRQAALVVNTKSRKGKRQFRHARRLLRQSAINLISARDIEDPSLFSDAVREAVDAGIPMVVVGGGDGSLLAAVEHFTGTETVLGVLPLGTANSFARALKLPLDLEGAVAILAEGQARRIDLGLIDGHLYAGCASMGLAPQIAETVPHGLKAWAGRPGYLLWSAGQLGRFHPFRLTIGEGATAETLDAVEVRIANGPFHGGVELVDQARLDSGRIVVQAVIGQKRAISCSTGLPTRSGRTHDAERRASLKGSPFVFRRIRHCLSRSTARYLPKRRSR